ncbi:MAG TPA: putative Ig domain-containing protein [Candidatus Limnocylindria bacterium]|nr:putative Ig domain-containing protein [Candidatus Limnocylindria bacterium]
MHSYNYGIAGPVLRWRRFASFLTLGLLLLGSARAATPLKITTTALPAATVGTPYSVPVVVTGGTPPYKWVLGSGGFPPGLDISGTTGVVAGTPTPSGSWIYSYPFQVYIKVSDAAGGNTAAAFVIKDNPPAGGETSGGGTSGGGTSGGGGSGGVTNPPPVQTYTLSVTNGSGGGQYAPGTSVTLVANPAPAGQVFKQWVGSAPVASSTSPTTTLTMPSANAFTTATYYTPVPVPFPVASHPRLWVTTNDLPRLRGWASVTNPIYVGFKQVLQTSLQHYSSYFPNGVANANYPDFGDTQGYQGLITEQDAVVLAFHSLIDPSVVNRANYAKYARNILMYALNQVVQGPAANVAFRDPLFSVYNRANLNSECWPLAVDWIYNAVDTNGVPVFSAQDKHTIRDAFVIWANQCLNAYTTGGDHPAPVGMMNSPALLPGNGAYRMAANNYYAGHARLLTMMSLCIDPVDDPAINAAQSSSILGNSLRSYITDATGAWLYQQFAMFGDPAAVKAAYNLPATASVGLASGGLPPEGMLYGHSYSYIMGQLLALQTAGFNDTTLSGPQVSLINAPVWDRFVKGMISSLAPVQRVEPTWPWLGPVYQMTSYGDLIRLWITPDFMEPFALFSLLEQKNGSNAHADVARWWCLNAVEGGAPNLINRVSQPWSYSITSPILYFLLFDPSAPTPSNPHTTMPPSFYDQGQGRLIARTDWSANASLFDFRCSWISINHQDSDAGQFEFYRKGEWLTKELSNYDGNGNGQASDFHNTLTIQHSCPAGTPTNLQWYENPLWLRGSQWYLGLSAGDPSALASVGVNYAYGLGDMTKLYNRPSQWTPANAVLNTTHASRSVLWVDDDYVVLYDRAATTSAGEFKRFNLNFPSVPNVTAHGATGTTPGGQHLFVQTLLPANPKYTTTNSASALSGGPSWLEFTQFTLRVEDPAQPASVRFLHVLQGADAGVAKVPATLSQSVAGTAVDGAIFANKAVFFVNDLTQVFAGTTVVVPNTVTQFYLGGLTPGANYGVIAQVVAGGLQVTVNPNGQTVVADVGGLLNVTF